MGRKKKYPVYEKIEVTDLAATGKSVAKLDNLTVFVKNGAVPGDVIDIQVSKKRRKYYEGYPIKFHKYSERRTDPVCKHFGVCGGCKWQQLEYSEQLKYKHQQVKEQLERIGKAKPSQINTIISADNIYYYRNKLEFAFSNKRWLTQEEVDSGENIENFNALGFHVPGRYDKVIDIEKCHLQKDPSNQIRLLIREYALDNGLKFFDLVNQSGLLRNIIIRTTSTNEVMVIVSFFKDDKKSIPGLLNYLKSKVKGITSLMYVINPKANDTINDLDIKVFHGRDHIIEVMDGLKFKIGPKSFFQTNFEQAVKLYRVTRQFANLSGKEIVYDLYTGTGTIANYIANDALKVIGVDNVEGAILDARENSIFNKITNTSFVSGDMKDVFSVDFMDKHGKPDVVILDPPRAGIHGNVIKSLLFGLPKRIVYVSCNPATQARDVSLLNEDYEIKDVQPVDMFPHTHHVENVVLLEKK